MDTVTIHDGNEFDIWVWDAVNHNMPGLTSDGASSAPVWSLDGERIVFASDNEGQSAICRKDADGTGDAELLGLHADQESYPWAWSADGKTLITLDTSIGSFDIGSLSMEGDHARTLLLQEDYNETSPQISPDGRWMAYTSDESGENRIYVRPFPEVDKERWQVSEEGGHSPLWSPDGRELFYRNDNEVVAVSVDTESSFEYGKREILFRGDYIGLLLTDHHTWDIHPDGKRFLMMKPSGGEIDSSAAVIPRKINIILNWFEELKKKVPTD